jgi:hypothetical protein
MHDRLIAVLLEQGFRVPRAEASRGERHLEVNCELAARCRHHSQENPTF